MKRIISLLLTLVMAMSFIPSAYAENSGDVFEITQLTTGSDFQGYYSMVDIKNLTSVSQTGVLVVASYSADGKFGESSSLGIFIPGNSHDTYTVHFESKPSNIQKAFILDDWGSLIPISDTCNLTVISKKFAADTYYPQYNLAKDKQYAIGYEKIRFGSTYYDFESSIDLYVNGVFFKTITASENISGAGLTEAQADLDWILGNAHGNITVLKSNPEEGYDTIFVNFYQIAEISSVDVDEGETTITLDDVACTLDTSSHKLAEIIISTEAVEEGRVTVTVTRNGEKATLDSLVNGDIIAYATDFTASIIENPKTIDIIATNNKASGLVTAIDMNYYLPDDNIYTIGGVDYMLVPSLYRNGDPNISIKDSLILTLDPFGRIYDFEIDPYATNYAIALKRCTEEDHIKLLLPDGSTKTYEVDTNIVRNYKADFVDTDINTVTNVADRVVTYEVSERSGKIISIKEVEPTAELADRVYKSRTSLLGSGNKILNTTPMFCIDKDAQNTIDTNNADNYSALSKSDLIDGNTYSGYIYKINTTVTFVVLTDTGPIFGEDSKFAVVIDTPAGSLTEDGDTVISVKVLYDGEEQDLIFTPAIADEIAIGDIFFFETNQDGYVSDVYEAPFADSLKGLIDTEDWSYNIWDEWKTIQFAQGVVTEVTNNYISFASVEQVESGVLDTTLDLEEEIKWYDSTNGIAIYGIADDCMAYTYDSGLKTRVETEKYDVTSPYSIKASDFTAFDAGNGILNDGIYQGDLMSKSTVATAMIVDGEVSQIFAIEK